MQENTQQQQCKGVYQLILDGSFPGAGVSATEERVEPVSAPGTQNNAGDAKKRTGEQADFDGIQ